ncbi:hypothetical protein Uis1B_1959 [Bifidobacterium margollesii]|uniref:Uncharacterized protein n=1 Tax=Bifidobacterium margollesii TaxID=2020964 RepID=A0A2N5J7M4_9BIFI|nr:hypothetical protein [Bifidobacterium margollesii]PLS30219.1 hypothetical protein Uis1B_1959 [Bifidobacterium margollesii]
MTAITATISLVGSAIVAAWSSTTSALGSSGYVDADSGVIAPFSAVTSSAATASTVTASSVTAEARR